MPMNKAGTRFQLLPVRAANLKYAGRLDKNSEGLLLLTNDGDMINLLTHPISRWKRSTRWM